jgi:hypothetical protein
MSWNPPPLPQTRNHYSGYTLPDTIIIINIYIYAVKSTPNLSAPSEWVIKETSVPHKRSKFT